MKSSFIFATGIENSNPTIRNGTVRVDEMEKCGHYEWWREDFQAVQDLKLSFLRYGPPLHRTYLGARKYDWSFADETFADLYARRITPIVDLCHFGVPDWIGNFQNPDFPRLFERYCEVFARRFPWVQLYTPVNEMYVCAMFSARFGHWNEQLHDDRAFVTALKHLVKANVLAMRAILRVRPDALFIQSESSEYFHADCPGAIKQAEILNAERFLSLDLNYGVRVSSEMYEFLMDNGMKRQEYHFFLKNDVRRHCIMGNDYYVTNEHRVMDNPKKEVIPSGEIFGYCEITRQYYERYRLPVMHTETNAWQVPEDPQSAVKWLWKEWANVLRLRNSGVPVVGFTWYSLTDQMDWDNLLVGNMGSLNPVGLYNLKREIRPVGEAYRKIVTDWSTVLPTQSLCLVLPLKPFPE